MLSSISCDCDDATVALTISASVVIIVASSDCAGSVIPEDKFDVANDDDSVDSPAKALIRCLKLSHSSKVLPPRTCLIR